MSFAWLLVTSVSAVAWLFPSPSDKVGWGLRVRSQNLSQPFLTRESLLGGGFEVGLINQSTEVRKYIPLEAARKIHDLKISLVGANETILKPFGHGRAFNRDGFQERLSLAPGHVVSIVLSFQTFGYYQLPEPGEYELRASLETAEGKIVAPSFKLKVIEPTADAILVSRPIPLEGERVKWPKERHERAVVQQIKVGDRTWLFYRQFSSPENGGKVSASFRIAELPGKVLDMNVEGAFGDWNPLAITYRETTYTKFTTTHVINSVDGRPWTAEEEKHRQDKLKREGRLPPTDKK